MSKILGIKIDEADFRDVIQKITNFLNEKKLHQIVTINPEFIVAAQKDREFKKILNQADLSLPDGFGLQMAAKFCGVKIGERITGVDLTWGIAKMASEKGHRLYLLGGKNNAALKTSKRLKLLYPKLKIAGFYEGIPDESGIINRINNSQADILLVAYGAPKQDKFIYKNRSKLKVKIAMGVGGTFDYISGNVPRAPKWMRALGLEWLYRLFKQPFRLKRILTAVIVFPLLVIFNKSK